MPTNPEPSAAHDLTVQQADALWDAVAVPGPEQPTFPAQHERVCRAVAAILSELPAVVSSPPATDRATPPAAWIDGHPQLEAIASAVYERCETGDGGIVHDDPRNIAVAVLAVLPPPAARAAVLREAADLITERQALLETEERADIGDLDLETIQQGTAVRRMASYLRSVADTAQPSEAEAAATHARGCLDRPAVIRWCADRVRSTDGDYVVQAAAEYLDDLATEAEEQAPAGEQRRG